MSAPVYLDYAASWPVDPRVAEAMTQALLEPDLQANPSAGPPGGRSPSSRHGGRLPPWWVRTPDDC
ncbi:MAG: hypothetical protein ACO22W_05075 [Steroidobacteraceae bacterium]